MNTTKIIIALSIISLFFITPTNSIFSQNQNTKKKSDLKKLFSIARQACFYANIQRVVRGKTFMVYDPRLEKTAMYQAEYCAKNKKLSRTSSEDNMTTLSDRIKHFKSSCRYCNEELYRFWASRYGISDSTSERSIAYKIIANMMYRPDTRKKILSSYNVMGNGIVRKGEGRKALYYMSHVFDIKHVITYNQCRNLKDFMEKLKKKDALAGEAFYVQKIKKRVLLNDRYRYKTKFIIYYRGNSKVNIIQLAGASEINYLPIKKTGVYTYEYKKDFKHKKYIFVAFTQGGMLYPAKSIW